MEIIQKKEIQCSRDERGWSVKPIPDEEITNGSATNIHIVSLKPGAVRGNHYHLSTTERVFILKGFCRVTVRDNRSQKKEELIIRSNCETLLVFPPFISHAIENIGTEVSYLFCYSSKIENSVNDGTVRDKIV